MALRAKRRGRTIGSRRAKLKPDCTYRVTLTFAGRRRVGRGRQSLRLSVLWLGNRFMEPKTVQTFTRRVG